MALSPLLYITLDYSTGSLVRIDDITGLYTADNTGGYGLPNPNMSAINKTRFLFSSYVTESTADQNVTECLANVEYVVNGTGANTVVVDTKTFVLWDILILRTDAATICGEVLTWLCSNISSCRHLFRISTVRVWPFRTYIHRQFLCCYIRIILDSSSSRCGYCGRNIYL